MKKEYLNKKVKITCIDEQIIEGIITEWENDYIDVNVSTEIPLSEVKKIELIEE